MSFSTKVARTMEGTSTFSLRLVRGASVWEGTRYLITTRSFASDAPNNAVVDRRTGLVWRRCLGTTVWNGSQCSGAVSMVSHNEVLEMQIPETVRLPSIKELQSLLDIETDGNVPSGSVFPQIQPGFEGLWSSTPSIADPKQAMRVRFVSGGESVTFSDRTTPSATIFIFRADGPA